MTAVEHFESLYRGDPDPWGYRSSPYERAKYAATLDACGPGPFASALELGGSIGVFSALLAPRCRALVTVDFSPTAVRAAQNALAGHPQARAFVGEIPLDIPAGWFDLVVASEVLYYLAPEALTATLPALEARMAPGARLVAVHWRRPGPERPATAQEVHDLVGRQPWLEHVCAGPDDEYLLDAWERRP